MDMRKMVKFEWKMSGSSGFHEKSSKYYYTILYIIALTTHLPTIFALCLT